MDIKVFTSQQLHIQTPALQDEIAAICTLSTVRRGALILQAGQPQAELFFLCEGLVRCFTTGTGRRDFTDSFLSEPGEVLLGCLDLVSPAQFSFQAMEDCILLAAPMPFVHSAMSRYPEAAQAYAQLVPKILRRSWNMKRILQHGSSRARYEWFLREYPTLQGRIPQKHISSFLGTTPENLSRLRAEVKAHHPSAKE